MRYEINWENVEKVTVPSVICGLLILLVGSSTKFMRVSSGILYFIFILVYIFKKKDKTK